MGLQLKGVSEPPQGSGRRLGTYYKCMFLGPSCRDSETEYLDGA